MTNDWSATRKQLEAKLIGKAWADADFKAKLLANPDATIKALLIEEGINLPESMLPTFKVFEENGDSAYIVLPVNPDDLVLSDEEMDLVAGGKCCK
jgi:hypothetical protein